MAFRLRWNTKTIKLLYYQIYLFLIFFFFFSTISLLQHLIVYFRLLSCHHICICVLLFKFKGRFSIGTGGVDLFVKKKELLLSKLQERKKMCVYRKKKHSTEIIHTSRICCVYALILTMILNNKNMGNR